VLVFLHVDSRRVFATPACFKPDMVWMRTQAEAFVRHVKASGLEADIVMHDRDGKFSEDFDQTLRDADVRVQKAAYRSPNTVAFVERFIQTLQQECLDYFIVFGERHMNHLVEEMVAFYHESRPHQAKDNDLLAPAEAKKCEEPDVVRLSEIRCKKRLGGMLKHYYRRAA
jgi:putative transposase